MVKRSKRSHEFWTFMLVEPIHSKTVLTSCASLLELCPLVVWLAVEVLLPNAVRSCAEIVQQCVISVDVTRLAGNLHCRHKKNSTSDGVHPRKNCFCCYLATTHNGAIRSCNFNWSWSSNCKSMTFLLHRRTTKNEEERNV